VRAHAVKRPPYDASESRRELRRVGIIQWKPSLNCTAIWLWPLVACQEDQRRGAAAEGDVDRPLVPVPPPPPPRAIKSP